MVTDPTPWSQSNLRRVSVNSFGFGGSNAHVILDDVNSYLASYKNRNLTAIDVVSGNGKIHIDGPYPTQANHINSSDTGIEQSNLPTVFILSSHYEEGVKKLSQSLASYLETKIGHTRPGFLPNLSYTLSERRSKLQWRRSITASSADELRELLKTGPLNPIKSAPNKSLAFVFSGQGAQWPSMGRELLYFDCFWESLNSASAYLSSIGCAWVLIGTPLR